MTTMTSPIKTAAKLYAQGNPDKADVICQQILKQDANNATALHLRGVIAYQTQNYAASTELLSKANQLTENNPSIMFALAASHENMQQYEPAILLYNALCTLAPNNIVARNQLSCALEKNHQYDEALESYLILNEASENNPEVLLALARLYANAGFNEKAKLYVDALSTSALNDAGLWNNAGLIYKTLNDTDKAITYFTKALSSKGTNNSGAKARLNLASILQDTGDFNLAKVHYLEVIRSEKNTPNELSRAHYNLALIYLGEGDFTTGWNHLIHRPKKFTDLPSLTDLRNKNLLILGEEGLGDELSFLRFIPLLKKHALRIEYITNPKLYTLLTQLDCIDQVHSTMPEINKFDYCISAMDLPYLLKSNDIFAIPPIKLTPVENNENDIINAIKRKKLTLGISWRSGITSKKGKLEKSLKKEIPLIELCAMIKEFSGTIVILQRDPTKDEIAYLKSQFKEDIIDASDLNNNLNLMLTGLNEIQHYIGVSNTNTHLFGSLGKRADVIIPSPGEWRWLWKGPHSPWYKGFSLIRQEQKNNWNTQNQNRPSYLTC